MTTVNTEFVDGVVITLGIVVLLALLIVIADGVWSAVLRRRDQRLAREEAELDRQAAALRQSILALAEQLGADAHEARKALIRESFLASGRVPKY